MHTYTAPKSTSECRHIKITYLLTAQEPARGPIPWLRRPSVHLICHHFEVIYFPSCIFRVTHLLYTTRHRASTSMYSLIFRVVAIAMQPVHRLQIRPILHN